MSIYHKIYLPVWTHCWYRPYTVTLKMNSKLYVYCTFRPRQLQEHHHASPTSGAGDAWCTCMSINGAKTAL